MDEHPEIHRKETPTPHRRIARSAAAMLQLWAEGATPSQLAATFGIKEEKVNDLLHSSSDHLFDLS
jgi:DNA-binding CsgD family transcriptional regulator